MPRKTNKNINSAIYSNLGLITFYLYSTSFIMYIIDYNDAIIKCVEYQNDTSISCYIIWYAFEWYSKIYRFYALL